MAVTTHDPKNSKIRPKHKNNNKFKYSFSLPKLVFFFKK